jgi:hypothetical protein
MCGFLSPPTEAAECCDKARAEPVVLPEVILQQEVAMAAATDHNLAAAHLTELNPRVELASRARYLDEVPVQLRNLESHLEAQHGIDTSD